MEHREERKEEEKEVVTHDLSNNTIVITELIQIVDSLLETQQPQPEQLSDKEKEKEKAKSKKSKR
jgi:hypothetical protein